MAEAISKKTGKIAEHDLYYEPGCLAAHHLICSEAMKDDNKWAIICALTGYNINCYKNGVYLPTTLKQACHAKVPLHRSLHIAGYGGANSNYPKAVKKEISSVLEEFEEGDICKNAEELKKIAKKLNDSSKKIFSFIKNFIWTITSDGFDYEFNNPIGCANADKIPKKSKKLQELRKERKNAQNDITERIVNTEGEKGYIQMIEDTREEQEKIVADMKSSICCCVERNHNNDGIKKPKLSRDEKYPLTISK